MTTLGKFVKEFYLNDDTYLLVRGLTVAEYIELSQRDFFSNAKVTPSLFVEIAMACVTGWNGVVGSDERPIEYHISLLEHLTSEEVLVDIGRFAIEEMTLVQPSLEEKIKGYVRFSNHISKEENKRQRETFDCLNCINGGYWEIRSSMCKKFTIEDVQSIRNNKQDIKEISEKKENINKAKQKLRAKRKGRARKGEVKAKSEIMFINNFKFPECPVSWIEEWIFTAGSVLYHSQASDIPFFSGGLADQPYKLYRISRIIAGESNLIDKEDFESKNK